MSIVRVFNPLKQLFRRVGLVAIIAVFSLVVILTSLQTHADAFAAQSPDVAMGLLQPAAYLYRFNPGSNTFYTLPLPMSSVPYGVAVTGTNPTHVWVAEFGRNRIGHLIYTNTSQVQWVEYPITSTINSGPYRIALQGNFVWFTERGANRVGRLNATTGELVEFYGNGLTSNAGLADIAVAPIGWVWVTGEASNSVTRLVVTSTSDFTFTPYTTNVPVGPFGLAVESDVRIWFTAPASNKLGRLSPIDGQVLLPFGLPADSRPYEFVTTPANGFGWFSDPQRNAIGQLEIGTLTNLNYHGPITRPYGLASASSTRLWFTQQDNRGAVGRLIFTSSVSTQINSYPLPVSGLRPTGIDVASDGGVWFAAFVPPQDVLLPVVYENH